MFLLGGVTSLLGGGTAAAGAATGAAAAGTGFSISSVLQGLATVGGIVATIQAGNAEAAKLEMQANDAEAEKPFETLQSIDRKRSLMAQAAEAVGASDEAYAASGVDLSFGSARQARAEVYRGLDLGLNTDTGTTATRLTRLDERAANYRAMAKEVKRSSAWDAFFKGTGLFQSLSAQA